MLAQGRAMIPSLLSPLSLALIKGKEEEKLGLLSSVLMRQQLLKVRRSKEGHVFSKNMSTLGLESVVCCVS